MQLSSSSIVRNRLLAISVMGIVSVFALGFPLGRGTLAAALAGYWLWLQRQPAGWLLVLPVSISMLNFSLWSGRIFFDVNDAVVLTTLAASLWRVPASVTCEFDVDTSSKMILLALVVSYVISTWIGIQPLSPIDVNSFNNLDSGYNALRIAKGFLWALLLLPILLRNRREGEKVFIWFSAGMIVAVILVTMCVLWERLVFTGLLDWSDPFRVTGMFWGMNTGGAYLDAFLAVGVMFLLGALQDNNVSIVVRRALALAFPFVAYAVAVTFSRALYAAVLVAIIVWLLMRFVQKRNVDSRQTWVLTVVAMSVALAITIPILGGRFASYRFSQIRDDISLRMYHWEDALQIRDHDVEATMFGMGMGSYPRTYLRRSAERIRPGTYQVMAENGTPFLRIGGADGFYIGQHVQISPHSMYRLMMKARIRSAGQGRRVSVCERALLYSFNCVLLKVVGGQDNKWQNMTIDFNSGEIANQEWFRRRPVFLSLSNSGRSYLDVTDMSLMDSAGSELLENGDFSQGMDHWFPTEDVHLPWHTSNLFLGIAFDMGLAGLGTFLLLLAVTLHRLWADNRLGKSRASILLGSLVAVLVIGLGDSLFDEPRITLLFYMLVLLALIRPNSRLPTTREISE